MADYIKREEAIHIAFKSPFFSDSLMEEIKAIPAADVSTVRHAKWVDNHCTACGMMPMGDEMWKNYDCEPPLFERFMDYCPICGAKMMPHSPKGE